jgi:UDPglucose 6-dehydrogenase
LLQTAQEAGIDQRIVRTVVEVNDHRKATMASRIVDALGGDVSGKRIGVLGLAFKPNTDDMRDAPSIPLVNSLIEQGAKVVAFDPAAMDHALPLFPGLEAAKDAYGVSDGADALVIVTEWDEFRALDLDKLAKRMRGRALVDLRNVYDPDEAERAGLDYSGVGRAGSKTSRIRAAAE